MLNYLVGKPTQVSERQKELLSQLHLLAGHAITKVGFRFLLNERAAQVSCM